MGYIHSEDLIFEKEDGIAILTLNRPERLNAFSLGIREGIINAAEEVGSDDSLKTLIITGAGRAFCAGADFKAIGAGEFPPKAAEGRRGVIGPLGLPVIALSKLEKPVIAAVNGVAVGGGFALSLACDIRIASDRARFNTQFVNRSVSGEWGVAWTLPRLVGRAKALELMWTGDFFDAHEALGMGIVNRVVPHDDLMKEARQFARRLAEGPSLAIDMMKHLITAGEKIDFQTLVELEMYVVGIHANTDDFKESTRAFVEKRSPVFKGH